MTPLVVGYTVLRTHDAARDRPILIDVWYPAATSAREVPHDYGLGRGRVAEHAAALDTARPLILLSHGAFGSARSYAWIAEHLVREGGYLVAGVSHFGESPVYGPETVDQAAVLRPWLRAEDCSFVLDYLISDSNFRTAIDPRRIGALGHSSGGATSIALAGATFNAATMRAYCASEAAADDKGCEYGRRAPGDPGDQEPSAPRTHDDRRISAIVALDPALGPGHDAASLARVSVPVHVVGAVANDFLPFDAHAGRYARLIPGASLTRLTGGEGHFVFLNACESGHEANGVSLCRDRAGVDRRRVHSDVAATVTAFFNRHLRETSPAPALPRRS